MKKIKYSLFVSSSVIRNTVNLILNCTISYFLYVTILYQDFIYRWFILTCFRCTSWLQFLEISEYDVLFLLEAFNFEVGKLLLNCFSLACRDFTLYKVKALKYNLSPPEIVICCGSLTLFTSCIDMNDECWLRNVKIWQMFWDFLSAFVFF